MQKSSKNNRSEVVFNNNLETFTHMAKTNLLKRTHQMAWKQKRKQKNNRAVAWDKSASKPRLGWYSEITDTLAGDHQCQKHTRTIIGLGKGEKKTKKKNGELEKNQ